MLLFLALAGFLSTQQAHLDSAAALNASSVAAARRGDYGAATRDARAAAELYHAAGDGPGEASALNNLGVAHTYAASYGEAADAFIRASSLSRASHDLDALAEHLMNLGNVRYYQAQYVAALKSYNDALALTRSSDLPQARRRHALLNINLATLHQRLGNDQAALQLYLDLGQAQDALKGHEIAQMLVNLGVTYRRLGDPHKALGKYEMARGIFARDRHLDGELSALKNRGIVLALDLGELPAAVETFNRAMKLAERAGARRQAMQAQLYRAEARYRMGDLRAARRDFEGARSLATELRTSEEQWKALYGLGRIALREHDAERAYALLAEAVATIEHVRERVGATSLKRDFFADKREVYDAVISLEVKRGDPRRVFEWLERSRSRTFQDRIRPNAGPPRLEEIQSVLPENVAVLEYWESRRGRAVVWITRTAGGLTTLDPDAQPSGSLLPQAALSAAHIVVVPDGRLSGVPFESFPIEGKALIERVAVSYMPSASLLLRPRTRRTMWSYVPWTAEVSAFADPRYANDELGDTAQRLVASDREARQVARSLRGNARLFLGPENRKAAFIACRTPVIHVATHATADLLVPERSRVLFSAPPAETTAEYLFLNEVYGLDLGATDLVTLSACDTERGKNVPGEGSETFSRALLAAGVRSTITTLWRVEDAAATAFMTDFYARLARGVPKAEALRQTKLRFVRSGTELADPKHWAAFVLSGEPFEDVPQPASWGEVIGWPALVALLVCAIAQGRKMRIRRKLFREPVATVSTLDTASKP